MQPCDLNQMTETPPTQFASTTEELNLSSKPIEPGQIIEIGDLAMIGGKLCFVDRVDEKMRISWKEMSDEKLTEIRQQMAAAEESRQQQHARARKDVTAVIGTAAEARVYVLNHRLVHKEDTVEYLAKTYIHAKRGQETFRQSLDHAVSELKQANKLDLVKMLYPDVLRLL